MLKLMYSPSEKFNFIYYMTYVCVLYRTMCFVYDAQAERFESGREN